MYIQIRYKKKHEIKEVGGLYYELSKHKGTDQFRGFQATDLHLCFCIYAKIGFSHVTSQLCTPIFIYWAKVLPEQWALLQIFRKHEIFRKKK